MKDLGIWHPKHSFIAPQADADSKHWKEHTNKCVLPDRRDVKPLPVKPDPRSILHPPVQQTPQAHSGTLVQDDGDGTRKPARRKSAHRKKY